MNDLIEMLAESRDVFLASAHGVSSEAAVWRPGDNRWCVLECAEHVANVEHRIFRTLQFAPAIEAKPADADRERRIFHRVSARLAPVSAPEQVWPSGRYSSLAEALDAFSETRRSAMEFLRTGSRDLRAIGAVHPLLGPCNGYEYALIMAAHPIRHAIQIRETLEEYRAIGITD